MSEEPGRPQEAPLKKVRTCPKCEHPNAANVSYCRQCGEPFRKRTSPTSTGTALALLLFLGVPCGCLSYCAYPGVFMPDPRVTSYPRSAYIFSIIGGFVCAVFLILFLWAAITGDDG